MIGGRNLVSSTFNKGFTMEHYIILAPHPDDELLMAGYYTMLPNSSVILVTDGGDRNRVEVFEERIMEPLKKPVHYLGFASMFTLMMDRQVIYKALLDKVHEVVDSQTWDKVMNGGIEYAEKIAVVLPSTNDTHPEHLLVSALGTRIGLMLHTEIIYASATYGHEHKVIDNTQAMNLFKKHYDIEFANLQLSGYDLSNKMYTTKLGV